MWRLKTLRKQLLTTCAAIGAAVVIMPFMATGAHAQSGTLVTSGMGGGASSTARLQAQVTQMQQTLNEMANCGGLGLIYGGDDFSGAKTSNCIDNFQVNETNDYSYAPSRLRVGSSAVPSQALDVSGNAEVSGNVGATNVNATNMTATNTITAGNHVIAESRLRVGSAGTPTTDLDVDGSADISAALTVGGNARAARFGAGVAPAHPLHVSGNGFITGNVGLGTAPTSNRLQVDGDGTFSGDLNASAFFYTSDRSLKENIQPIQSGVKTVQQLRPVNFKWKDRDETSPGFIAQEVEQVIPEIVQQNNDGVKSVDYAKMVAHLVAAVQEQQAEIEQLKAEVEKLR